MEFHTEPIGGLGAGNERIVNVCLPRSTVRIHRHIFDDKFCGIIQNKKNRTRRPVMAVFVLYRYHHAVCERAILYSRQRCDICTVCQSNCHWQHGRVFFKSPLRDLEARPLRTMVWAQQQCWLTDPRAPTSADQARKTLSGSYITITGLALAS